MQTKFNGILLEERVPGFITTNIDGRALLRRRQEQVTVPGRDGVVITGDTLPPRTLTVNYFLKRNNSIEFLESLSILHKSLQSQDDAEISFSDEEDVYYGRFQTADNPPIDDYRGLGSFTLICQDPYRYGNETRSLSNSNTVDSDVAIPVIPERISIDIQEEASCVELVNSRTGNRITFNFPLVKGDKVSIDYSGNNIKALKNDRINIMQYLVLESDIERFELLANDTVIVTPSSSTFTVQYRKKAL